MIQVKRGVNIVREAEGNVKIQNQMTKKVSGSSLQVIALLGCLFPAGEAWFAPLVCMFKVGRPGLSSEFPLPRVGHA